VKSLLRNGILACLLALLGPACGHVERTPTVRDGDLIFQTSRSSQSVAIQRATGSAFSHMGLVFFQDGKPYVFEASRLCDSHPWTVGSPAGPIITSW
jgi:hypothetical protein